MSNKQEKIFDKKMMLQIGMGVLLYLLLRRSNHSEKTENKPVDIKGEDNKVTKGVNIELNNPALIRVDPNISVTRYFKNSEYFGKTPKEVPQEHYENWGKLSEVLTYFRMIFKKPILISKGYNTYKDGRGAVIRPQNGDYNGLWNSVGLFLETNKNIAKSVTRLANNWIEVII